MGGVVQTVERVAADIFTLGAAELLPQVSPPPAAAPPAPVVQTPPPAPVIDTPAVAAAGDTAQVAVNNNPTTGKPIGFASTLLTAPLNTPADSNTSPSNKRALSAAAGVTTAQATASDVLGFGSSNKKYLLGL